MKYDPFQKQAIDYINQGHSVIVSAPTGAGKTAIAEHIIQECLKRKEKVIYTAPIKALSNQKYREFQKYTQDHVGILTGDITLNAKASVLVMTTEIFRNKILEQHSSIKDYSWIVFDEIHYLDDWERGTVWEESLIFMPHHMRFLGLSATIPNIDELKQWLESVHDKQVKIVKEDKRPVPLHFRYQCQSAVYDDVKVLAQKGFAAPGNKHLRGRKLPRSIRLRPNRLMPLILDIQKKELMPCIYFTFSRRRTEELATEMLEIDFLDEKERAKIVYEFQNLCERYDLQGEKTAEELKPLIRRGIAYHHAGMLPTLKEVVEQLFTSKLLKLIFTTETFALGINMPAKTVIFDELRKFYGKSFSNLRTRDFYQMAGRAGRRSIDTEGFVYCRVNPHYISPQEIHKIIFSEPEKVNSQFNASYATVLNLYNNYGEKLYDIYPKSFHYFQKRKFLHKQALYLLKAKVDILKELRYIDSNGLTEKGMFASKVYGYELVLSELFDRGVLEDLSVKQLGVLCLAIVYEPRKGAHKPQLKKEITKLEMLTDHIVRDIRKLEKAVRLNDLSKKCYFHLSPAFEAWIRQESFAQILEYIDADEGEVVRYFRMTIQVLREVADTPISDLLKGKIHQLIDLIDRDVVDSEKQLST